MTEDLSSAHFVSLFRSVAPYVNLFRGKTFVIAFGGRAISGPFARALAYDANLLAALGVHLVLVHVPARRSRKSCAKRGWNQRATPATALPTRPRSIASSTPSAASIWRSARCCRRACPIRRWPTARSA